MRCDNCMNYSTMTDREMLEIAARAMGIQNARWVIGFEDLGLCISGLSTLKEWWNPLNNSGETLDMANEQEISITFTDCSDNAPIVIAKYLGGEITNCNFPDPYKATRRTVVQAVVKQQLQLEEAINGL